MTYQPEGIRSCTPGPRFEEIIQRGNRELGDGDRDNWIACADGATLSVLAGPGAYCTPRVALSPNFMLPSLHEVSSDFPGPYTAVEVGYPDPAPEPSDDWDTEDVIYGFVPVQAVRDYIAAHGGEAPAGLVLSAPGLSPTEAATVARFDAAPPLPELDEDRVDDLAYELASLLATDRWYDMPATTRNRWAEVARIALTVPGVAR